MDTLTRNGAGPGRVSRAASRVQHPRTASGRQRGGGSSSPALPQTTSAHPSGGRTGQALPRWPARAWVLMSVVVAMVGIGLVMVLSASIGLRSEAPWRSFVQQLIWAGFGAVALVSFAVVDYRRWRRYASVALALVVLALIAVLTPLSRSVNGSRRWIPVGPVRIQPSEVAKLVLTVAIAALLSARAHRLHVPRMSTRPVVLASLVVCVLIGLEPDMGTTMIVTFIVAAMLVSSGVPGPRLARMALKLAGVVAVFAVLEGYRRDRLLTFLHPDRDIAGLGYHLRQSLVGLDSGNLFGVGIGNGRAKLGYLPNASTDFIVSVIGEELGLIGTLLIIGLMIAFGILGYRIARNAVDDFGYLLAVGITTGVLAQAFFNIGAVCGVLPITGVPLPFMSAGGSSLMTLLASVGLLLSVARRGGVVEEPTAELVSALDDSAIGRAVTEGVRHHPSRQVPRRRPVAVPTRSGADQKRQTSTRANRASRSPDRSEPGGW